MTIRHLKTFLCVAETGSITGAAKKLYVSQPSVSLTIR
jgi:DNA-binding transcriptional LysR family regulator